MEVILGKMGEVVLKGLNRRNFESRMLRSLRYRLLKAGNFKVYAIQSTVYVEPLDEDADTTLAFELTKRLFGLVSVSLSYSCEKDIVKITEAAKKKLGVELSRAKTFKVESKRSDKNFPMSSIEISQTVGGDLHDAFPHLTVDLHNPEVTVYVEVRDFAAFVHTNPSKGAGGLPPGTSGRAAILLSGGLDSPVAAYMMAKRGLELEGIHFYSYPYTSERAKQKVLTLAEILTTHVGYMTVHIVPFTQIQEKIHDECPEEYFTLIMRRSMMRISDAIAKKNECDALITGESLGQVASQTIKALGVTGDVATLPVFRPLIGMDKEEIVRISRKIDTYETSILPYEDCCTVFTPKHPRTNPRLSEVEKIEQAANLEPFEAVAIENVEAIQIKMKR